MARSRYLLYKAPNNWTQSQYLRSKILFEQYPDIKKAYNLALRLASINKI
ncbi:transposase [Jejuia pallidilutea]|nr:transposase [Jejuia pallidilutea]